MEIDELSPLTCIGKGDYYGSLKNNEIFFYGSGIKTMKLGNNITEIGGGSFLYASSLEKIIKNNKEYTTKNALTSDGITIQSRALEGTKIG